MHRSNLIISAWKFKSKASKFNKTSSNP